LPAPGLPNPSAQPLEAHGVPSEDDAVWTWWRLFLDSQYLRRLWVVQEFALAKRITLWFGTVGIDPNMVADCLGYLWKYSSNRGYYVSEGSSETVASSTSIAGFSALVENRGTEHCLINKLSLVRTTLATDKRDKIYGMLGLASDGLNFLPLVSYSKNAEAVYEDFAREFVDRGQGMELLYQVDSRVSETLQIPTWVPVSQLLTRPLRFDMLIHLLRIGHEAWMKARFIVNIIRGGYTLLARQCRKVLKFPKLIRNYESMVHYSTLLSS
jgi:hypothetical protein